MSTSWTHFNPVKVLAGRGRFEELGKHLEPGNWLLITTPGSTTRGLTARVREQLSSAHSLFVCDTITPNPELDELDRLTAVHAKDPNLTGIIGLGGGSALDAAKVLSVTLPSGQSRPLAAKFREGRENLWSENLPVVAIPTTAGTGAEVTPFATVWDRTDHKKYSVTGDPIFPHLAVLDPNLTLTLPEEETLYTALDATSHALESLWNKNRTPVSEAYAWQALELLISGLPNAISNLSDIEAREALHQASLLAGLAISQTRTALAHSISYPLTSHYGVPHGLACSFTLPTILKTHLLVDNVHKNRRSTMDRCLELLQQINLAAYLRRYVNEKEIVTLFLEMKHPERAGNFCYSASIEEIIEKSIK